MRGRNGDLVVVAVKTSNDVADGLDATLVGLLARTPPRDAGGAGQGSLVPAGTVAEDHSRPVVLVDAENRELLFLSTSRPAGGDVYLKRTPPSKLHFPYGRGVPFLAHDTPVQDVTGTKQRLSRRSGVLALASSHGQHRYVYAESALKPTGVGP